MNIQEQLNFYTNAANRVVLWNEAVGKLHIELPKGEHGETDFSAEDKAMEDQRKRVTEELKEMIDAQEIFETTGQGFKDFCSEVCDLFVVSTMFYRMISGSNFVADAVYCGAKDALEYIYEGYEVSQRSEDEEFWGIFFVELPYAVVDLMIDMTKNTSVDFVGLLDTILKQNENKFYSRYERELAEHDAHIYCSSKGKEVVVKELEGTTSSVGGYWLCRVKDNKVMKPIDFEKLPVDHYFSE